MKRYEYCWNVIIASTIVALVQTKEMWKDMHEGDGECDDECDDEGDDELEEEMGGGGMVVASLWVGCVVLCCAVCNGE